MEEVTKPLALGKAVHRAIESVISGASKEDALINGLIEAEFHPQVTREEMNLLLNRAPIYEGIGETEVHFTLPLSGEPDAPMIQGYIDLIKGDKIIDWKTNWKPYAIGDMKQLPLYAWAYMVMKERSFVRGNLFFLRFPHFTEARKYNRVITKEEAEEARAWAYKKAREINDRIMMWEAFQSDEMFFFPPTPSSECKYCSFAIQCYQNRKGVMPYE